MNRDGETHQESGRFDTVRASHAQQQLFYAQGVLGDSPAYSVPLFFRVGEEVDASALRRAVGFVGHRHEALRTHLMLVDGRLMQAIDLEWTLDWSEQTYADETQLAEAIEAEAARPFDLRHGPLFRAGLSRCPGGSPVLKLCLHHIICDGWSINVLLDEIVQAYTAYVDDTEPDLAEPDYQYSDYSVWQDEWLRSPSATRQLAYWQRQLGGVLPVLEIGDCHSAASQGTGVAGTTRFPLPAIAVDRLRALARGAGTTAFAALLSAFHALLDAYTSVGDVIVGVPVANRTRPEFARAVGLFVNMVAIRSQVSAVTSFRDLLAEVHAATLDAYENQEVPFETVVQAINPHRAIDADPVFQVLFMSDDATSPGRTGGGLTLEPIGRDSQSAKFALLMQIVDDPVRPMAVLEYDRSRISEAWALRLADSYCRLLKLVAGKPDQSLREVFQAPAADLGGYRLRTVDGDYHGGQSGYAAPRDQVETALARIWANVLQCDRVGIDDNYFETGGDSIRTIQILAKAGEVGLRVGLRDLLLHQTIRELAPLVVVDDATPSGITEWQPFDLLTAEDRAHIPEGIADAYPMTALQAGMVYHGELSDQQRIYHNVANYHLRARYHEDAWREAVDMLLSRHEMLRTSFAMRDFSEPLQLVHAKVDQPVSFNDISMFGADAQTAEIDRRFRLESATGFDLERAPLIRFHVQRRAADEMQLWIVEHHAIMDGWSAQSLFAELLDLYIRSLDHGGDPPPPPGSRFRQLVTLERAAAASSEERDFWTEELAEFVVTELPHRPADRPSVMRMSEHHFDPDTSARIVRLAGALGVPVRVVLLAAHLRVMAYLAGTQDVVTGVVYNGRVEEPDGDRVVGLFLNTLPFRHRFTPGSWADLIREVSDADMAIQPHRRFPMSEIQRVLGVAPLFETFFNYTHFHIATAQPADGIEVLSHDGVVPTSFPFGAEFFRDARTDRIGMGLRHDTARFTEIDVSRVQHYYVAAVRAMLADPHGSVEATNLLSDDELVQLAAWNDTAKPYDRPHLLQALFTAQVGATPQAPAVQFGDSQLTYADLDARTNQLAHRLIAAGLRPGDFVGVCLERSLEMVVSLLGVVKAGGAYVPVDPDDPDMRIKDLLARARVHHVLTSARLAGRLRATGLPVDVIAIDDGSLDTYSSEASDVVVSPTHPAYLIFTSGSTGQPKGVVVSHRAISNRLLWMQDEFGIGEGDRVLQKTPFTFDVSVWEFFWPLMQGACLVVARPGGHRDPEYLADLIRSHLITTVHFTPPMLRAFLEHDGTQECRSLRRVICSGEVLPVDLKDEFLRRHSCELINMYGPTEAAIDVTFWRCPRVDGAGVPIGHPIANIGMHVLDAARQPVPVGVTGELYISGVGLADGYHGQPQLTAERFVERTQPDGALERLYRTGDLGRRLSGGELEYLGRVDDQVKIRGFRVELGEIEATLLGHPGVLEAAAVARDGRLIAYVVAGDGRPVDTAALLAYLSDRLPDYMVPVTIVPLAQLPLSRNGKVVRERLPDVDLTDRRLKRVAEPAVTDTQHRLVAVWEDVLGVRPVGIHDSFFDLGGHSLLALRLVMLIRREFNRKLPVADLLAHNTIAKLERVLDAHATSDDGAQIVRLRGAGSGEPLLLIHPVGGGVFCYLPLVAALAPRRPVFGLTAEGLLAGGVTNMTVEDIAASYVRLIDTRQPRGPYHLGGWSFGAVVAYEIARRLHRRGDEVATLCMIDAAFPGQLDERLKDEDMAFLLFVDVMRAAGMELPAPAGAFAAGLAQLTSIPDKLAWLIGQLRDADHGQDADFEQWDAYFKVFSTNLMAHNEYRPGQYSGDVTYIEGTDSWESGSAAMWRSMVDGRMTIHTIDANHYDVIRAPYVQMTSAIVDELLARE